MLPFIDLKAQQDRIRQEVEQRILAVLDHGKYIMGPEVAELERRLAEFTGVKHAIGCSSGTDALLLSLMAHGVGPGDAVFTTPFTFIATAEVVSLLGATPVFVDIDPDTYNIDPASLQQTVDTLGSHDRFKNLTARGIIGVDLFGLPADYESLGAIAEDYGLFVLEDAAQSFGASTNGRRAGNLAHSAATSFFPAKPLGGYGDGGAVFTSDDEFADAMRSIRIHGKGADKYDNVRVGLNARLDTLQAAILLPKLDIFEEEIELRGHVAGRYNELLGAVDGVAVPEIPKGNISAWAQYTIRVPERDHVQAALKDAGVPTAIYYPKPLHLQTAYASLGYVEGDFPVSEQAAREVLSLPMHPYLSEKDQDTIAHAVKAALS
ncbi:aminotransferase DegT [Oceanidesulfovibrio indonesiensis]|uniref:Aminotransferase DegT n=1 Tax=Oceanidesulfovibrio indonesiensis TaxID=54767 RepID=A0A7M3MC17_9BACT|nr:DegT/DnrJ/EryC1/StrS aminotransferase family protein [Oceanidesulfovibrio indonesiensis]TVM15338.1 aminotransferase DegT [Oceanidesulfovibrio indonesiensis]